MKAFRLRSLVVFLILLATFLLHLFWADSVKWLFPVASWGGILYLAVKAARRRGTLADLNVQVAAESILTIGTVSIVLTLIHGFMAVMVNFTGDLGSLQKHVWDIAAPFGEGLISSAISLFASNFLRQTNAMTRASMPAGGGGGGSGGLSIDPATTIELAKLRTNLEAFNRAAEEAAQNTSDLNRLLKQVGSLIETMNKFFVASGGRGGAP